MKQGRKSPKICIKYIKRGTFGERETEGQRERERQTERHRVREREKERKSERERERERKSKNIKLLLGFLMNVNMPFFKNI